ncbi:MAG TPA: hypothetical protein VHR47_07260 [Bacillota bacterium]|nr:hypothetical protein [Bacillota bacterium]
MNGLVSAVLKGLDKGTLEAFVPWRDWVELDDENAGKLGTSYRGLAETECERDDPKRLLEKMMLRYSVSYGIGNTMAWQDFDRAFRTAYRRNLTVLRRNYCRRAGLTYISRSVYFERVGRLEDALGIAGRLLSQTGY